MHTAFVFGAEFIIHAIASAQVESDIQWAQRFSHKIWKADLGPN